MAKQGKATQGLQIRYRTICPWDSLQPSSLAAWPPPRSSVALICCLLSSDHSKNSPPTAEVKAPHAKSTTVGATAHPGRQRSSVDDCPLRPLASEPRQQSGTKAQASPIIPDCGYISHPLNVAQGGTMTSLLRLRRPAATEGSAVPASAPSADAVISVPRTSADPNNASQQQHDPDGQASLMSLPTELHLAISKLLIYPDALSLKHTNRHFYSLTDTGTELKVEWLLERRSLHLECPNDRRCDLGSDLRFCRGSVPLLMRRRREHIECDSRPGVGCLVFGTKTCVHRKRQSRWRRWMGTKLTVELWWVLLTLVPVLCFWAWVIELFRGA